MYGTAARIERTAWNTLRSKVRAQFRGFRL
jgi:hypothetical protein